MYLATMLSIVKRDSIILDNSKFKKNWLLLNSTKKIGHKHGFYAVKTTGVYCLFGCSSRLPNIENVEFFDTASEAIARHYRACKRCKPENFSELQYHNVAQEIKDFLISNPNVANLSEISKRFNYSRSHLTRLFKKKFECTPKQFLVRERVRKFKLNLIEKKSVTYSIMDAGYNSFSTAYRDKRINNF